MQLLEADFEIISICVSLLKKIKRDEKKHPNRLYRIHGSGVVEIRPNEPYDLRLVSRLYFYSFTTTNERGKNQSTG